MTSRRRCVARFAPCPSRPAPACRTLNTPPRTGLAVARRAASHAGGPGSVRHAARHHAPGAHVRRGRRRPHHHARVLGLLRRRAHARRRRAHTPGCQGARCASVRVSPRLHANARGWPQCLWDESRASAKSPASPAADGGSALMQVARSSDTPGPRHCRAQPPAPLRAAALMPHAPTASHPEACQASHWGNKQRSKGVSYLRSLAADNLREEAELRRMKQGGAPKPPQLTVRRCGAASARPCLTRRSSRCCGRGKASKRS